MSLDYFDSSVFLAIFNGESVGEDIRSLLKELKKKGREFILPLLLFKRCPFCPSELEYLLRTTIQRLRKWLGYMELQRK